MDITLDFETYYDTKYSLTKLSMVEYINDPRFKAHMVSIKIDNEDVALVDGPDIKQALLHLQQKAREDGEQIRMIAQNVLFDGYICYKHYGFVADFYCDTAAMSRALAPHAKAGLKHLMERLFPDNAAMQKGAELAQSKGIEDLHSVKGLFESIGTYCIKDTALTYIWFKAHEKKMPVEEMEMIDLISKMFCNPILQLDLGLLHKYRDHLVKLREETIKATGYAEEDFRSDKKFVEVLSKKNIKPPMKISPTTGLPIPALAKNDLAFQKLQREMPEHVGLWKARIMAKSSIDLSRTERMINIAESSGGELPAALKFSAAHTHRLGGTDKTNLQNLPRNASDDHPDGDVRPGVLRRAMIAPDDQVVLVRDLSNIEARVLAVISDQADLIELFKVNGDPYSAMAERIYNKPINKHDNPFERGVGKVAVLGLGYGMSGPKFKDTLNSGPLGMPPIFFDDETLYDRIVYDVYRKVNSGIVNFWRTCDRFVYWMATAPEATLSDLDDKPEAVLDHKCLRVFKENILLPNGLTLQYPNLRHENNGWMYDGKNGRTFIYGGKLAENIVQALAQIIIKKTMLETAKRLPNWRVALQVHDETVNVGPEHEAEYADKVIEEIMGTPPEWMPNLPLNSDGGWAKNYSK